MTAFGSFDNSTCKRVLDLLELGGVEGDVSRSSVPGPAFGSRATGSVYCTVTQTGMTRHCFTQSVSVLALSTQLSKLLGTLFRTESLYPIRLVLSTGTFKHTFFQAAANSNASDLEMFYVLICL